MNGLALSDLLLALVSLTLAWRLGARRPGIAIAFLLLGVAAACGVLRFMGVTQALGPHRFLSLLGACAAVPLLAASLRWPDGASAQRAAAAARFVVLAGGIGVLATVAGLTLWGDAAAALSALVIAVSALQSRRALAIAAGAALIAAFAAGAFGAMAQLHMLMALSFALMGWQQARGTQQQEPTKPRETYE